MSEELTPEQVATMIGLKIIELPPGAGMVMGFEDNQGGKRRWFCCAVPEHMDHQTDEQVAAAFGSGVQATTVIEGDKEEVSVKIEES